MSTSEVFKKFYVQLVKKLPMNDTLFTAELFANDLLPGDQKERVESLPTKSDKASYFLDHVIKPSVTSDDGSSFDKLLNVMEDSDHQGVKELAKLIRTSLRKRSNSDNAAVVVKGNGCTRESMTNFKQIEFQFAKMTGKIKQALISSNVDVVSLIEQLCTISAVKTKKVPLFDKDIFDKVKSIYDFWKMLRGFFSIFDYDLLQCIVEISECTEARNIFEEFLSRIDPLAIKDADLVLDCRVEDREGSLKPVLRIKVNCRECTVEIKNMVEKEVSKTYDLNKLALRFRGIREGCIELQYFISKSLKFYLIHFKISEDNLKKFLDHKIISLHVDEFELTKTSENISKVVSAGSVHTEQYSNIPGIHSPSTSEPATTVKCSPLDVNRLKARYTKLLPTGKTDWPKHKVTQYVRLAIVKKEDVTLRDKHLNELTRLTLQGDVDKILKKKEPLDDLKDIFHYRNEDCPRLILIMGGPGIGKTTLCHELCLRWARDGYLAEDFDAVVLILLRSVQQRSIKDVIKEEIGKSNYQQLKKSAGSRCLIILEGFDELAVSCRQNDPFLIRLIKKCNKLEEATILITSRPHACEEIDAGRIIEVVGFGNHEIKAFAEKSFPNDIEEFLRQLNEYPQLHSLCYIPMNLVMLVDIFHCSEKKLPSTLTELYQLFIVMNVRRQFKKENIAKKPAGFISVPVRAADSVEETLCVMFRGIPKETVGMVLCLSRLAYRGFFDWYCHKESKDTFTQKTWKEPKIIFTESDLIQCDIEITSDFDGFGLLKATPTHELLTDINTYSFNHLTIQEFLCAVYISLQSQQEQLHLLREHFHEYPNVFTFVCGLTGLASSEMFQFMYSKLTSLGDISSGDPNVITAIRYINESKRSSGPHQSVSPFTLDLTLKTLLPYDCVCVSNILSRYPVLALKMRNCHIGNKGAELLVKHYPYINSTGQLLEELYLGDNDLTIEGMKHVMKIVRTSSATLRVLDVSYNDINDDGMAVISEALQHDKSLTTLWVGQCGLSVKGAVYLSQLLNITHALQELSINNNDISDDGMAVISEALQHKKSFTTLIVFGCGLSVKGAVYISQLLTVTHTLQELNISYNNISDDGMAVISEALQHNKSLTTLDVIECGLSVKGAVYISRIVTHLLQELNISYNNISDDGMAVISEALQHNKSLTTLRVTECGLSVKGAISISKMMMVNHSLQELYMNNNNIGDSGISAIAEALGNCKINLLRVIKCNITLYGATMLAAALSSNHTIRELMLWGNAITVEGALLIVKSAVDNTVCQFVGIDDEYKNDEVLKMMSILKERERQYELLQQPQSSDMEESEESDDLRGEELIHEPIGDETMERCLMNQNEDDHSGEQEETRGCRDDSLPH